MLLGQRLDRRSGDEYLPTFRCLGRWWQGAYDDPIRQPNLYCRKRSRGKWRRKRSRIMRGEVGEGKDEKWIWERYNNNNNNNNDQYLGMFGAMASRGRLVEVRVYNQVSCLLSILFVVWQHWSQFKKQSQMWPHVNGLGCTAAVQISHQSCTRQSKARHSEFRAGLFLTRRTELIYVVWITYDASLFQFQLNRNAAPQVVTAGYLNEKTVHQRPYCALLWNKVCLWCEQGWCSR